MKAILVIDMPKECWDCPLHRSSWDEDNEEIMICRGKYMESHYGERPDWCPLKPLPEKKHKITNDYESIKSFNTYFLYRDGWNDCIDEILGETI